MDYIPSSTEWVRKQVELYEGTDGAEGADMRGLPVIIVTHHGRKTGAIRKTPLMRVIDGDKYVLVGSRGGAAEHPLWVHNLRADADVEIRDKTAVHQMRAREVQGKERTRLWKIAVATYPSYEEYQQKTARVIPVFLAEPV